MSLARKNNLVFSTKAKTTKCKVIFISRFFEKMTNKIFNRIPKYVYPIVATLLFVAIFWVFHRFIGGGLYVLAIFPIAIIGWFYGIRLSLLSSFIFILINLALFIYFNAFDIHKDVFWSAIPGLISVIFFGIAAGWISDLNSKLKKELSERKKYEIALQKSEKKFRTQFENLVEGVAIDEIIYENGKPVDWIITDVNPAYERIMKLSREEVLGKHATMLYGSYKAIEPFLETYDHVLRTGEIIVNKDHHLIRDRKIVISASSLGDNQVAVTFTDITEQENAVQSELKQREYLLTMSKITSALNETMKLDDVLNIILENLEQFVSFDAADITLFQDGHLKIAKHIGYDKFGLKSFADNFDVDINKMSTGKWMLIHQQPLIVADTSQSEIWTTFTEVEWIKSYLGLPIFAKGIFVGVINFLSSEKGFYENFSYEPLIPFSEQAAIAIENTRTFEEIQERSQRLAIINQIAFQMNQPAELEDIQQLAVDSLAEALNINQVGLAMINSDRKTMTVVADHPGPGNHSVKGSLIPLENNPSMDYILKNKKSFLSTDAQNDPMLSAVNNFMVGQHIYSILIIPLIVGGEVIGTLGCDIITENRVLTQEEISLAEILTNLVAGRIELERLISKEKKLAMELSMLYETSLAITKPYEISNLHNQIIENATWLLGADAGILYLKLDDEDVFECKVNYKNQYDPIGNRLKAGEGAVGIVAQTSQPLIIEDYGTWEYKPPIFSNIKDHFSLLTVPVIYQSQILGVIQILRESDKPKFVKNDANLLSLFSNQVAITLENARLLNEMQELALHDPLTGTLNRRGFGEIAEREIEMAHRFNHPLSLLFLDLDEFKSINDTHGHAVGDQILVGIANRCKNTLRNVDVICRYGGEEFLIMLMESDLHEANEIAKRINKVIKLYPFHTEAGPINLTVSIGAAQFENHMKKIDTLINNADIALYKAKSSGRDRVEVFLNSDSPSQANDFLDNYC